jgi:hypothetical protein
MQRSRQGNLHAQYPEGVKEMPRATLQRPQTLRSEKLHSLTPHPEQPSPILPSHLPEHVRTSQALQHCQRFPRHALTR